MRAASASLMQHRPRTGAKQSSTRPKPGDAPKQKNADAPPPQRRQHQPQPPGGRRRHKKARRKPRQQEPPRGSESARTPEGGGAGGHRRPRPRRARAQGEGARGRPTAPRSPARAREGAAQRGETQSGAQGRPEAAERNPCAQTARRAPGATGARAGGTPRHAGAGAAAHPSRSEGRAWRGGKGAATERAAPRRERIHFNPPEAIKAGGGTGRKGGPPPKRPARCVPDNLHSAKSFCFLILDIGTLFRQTCMIYTQKHSQN